MCDIAWCFVPSFFHIFSGQTETREKNASQKAPLTIQNLGETSEAPIYRCKKHTQPVSFPLHSHSFPIQCWLYLYFSSLKHVEPHFWGVGSTLKHSSFKKNMASSILFTLLNPLFLVVPWYFPLNSTLFPSVFHQNSHRLGPRKDGVQVRLRMHRHLPTKLRLLRSREVDSCTASTKAAGVEVWRCECGKKLGNMIGITEFART